MSLLSSRELPDHPALSEMGSIADLSHRYRSLTARKLLSGTAGSVTSIDTLVEVRQLLVIITWL